MRDDFDDWVHKVFAHEIPPAGKPAWYFEAGGDPPLVPDPEQALSYLTKLFEAPKRLLASYTPEQIGQGCWYLTDPSCSNHMLAMADETIAWSERERGLRAIVPLFSDLLRHCCTQDLGHTEVDGASIGLANRYCYMFWDICPLSPTEGRDGRRGAVCLDVMRAILEIPHEACEESALHGLGEWATANPTAVRQAIDAYLRRRRVSISPELLAFAERRRH